jgi:hypothetical protein
VFVGGGINIRNTMQMKLVDEPLTPRMWLRDTGGRFPRTIFAEAKASGSLDPRGQASVDAGGACRPGEIRRMAVATRTRRRNCPGSPLKRPRTLGATLWREEDTRTVTGASEQRCHFFPRVFRFLPHRQQITGLPN